MDHSLMYFSEKADKSAPQNLLPLDLIMLRLARNTVISKIRGVLNMSQFRMKKQWMRFYFSSALKEFCRHSNPVMRLRT